MGNRVEELEQQVAELRAVVDGLTEELVETKERLSQLEADADTEATETDGEREQAHAEFVPNQAPEEHTEYVGKDGAVETSDGTETAQSEARTATRGDGGSGRSETATTESEGTRESDEGDSDDIIVA